MGVWQTQKMLAWELRDAEGISCQHLAIALRSTVEGGKEALNFK